MSRVCEFCDKKTAAGRQYTTRGLPKYKGGIGLKTTGITNRKFKANIQKVRAVVNGTVRRVKACAACIRAGKVVRPPLTPKRKSTSAATEA